MIDPYALQASDSLLRQFSQTFLHSNALRPEGDLILITVGLAAVIVLVYGMWKWFRGDDGESPLSGATVLPRDIALILTSAMDHRSRIDLSFHPIATSRQTISCSLYDLSDQGVTLELPLGVNPSEAWIGKLMVCYFRIPRENKPPYFYTFVSSVVGMRRKGDIDYLILAVPAKVELGQKRKHLRLEIPSTDIKDFRVWPAAEDGTFHFESDPGKWPEPLAVYTREAQAGLRVLDLSGGGIRLAFDPHRYTGLDDFVARHPVLFMRLELEPTGSSEFPPCIMAARLRTKAQDFDHGTLMFGYEFVECCAAHGTETIDWVKIEPERGIDALVTWIFKRHLELYREREII
jgi:hypothetical protein